MWISSAAIESSHLRVVLKQIKGNVTLWVIPALFMNSAQFRVALNSLINWLSKRNSVSCHAFPFLLLLLLLKKKKLFLQVHHSPVEGSLWHIITMLLYNEHTQHWLMAIRQLIFYPCLSCGLCRGGCSLSWGIMDREHLINFPTRWQNVIHVDHILCARRHGFHSSPKHKP